MVGWATRAFAGEAAKDEVKEGIRVGWWGGSGGKGDGLDEVVFVAEDGDAEGKMDFERFQESFTLKWWIFETHSLLSQYSQNDIGIEIKLIEHEVVWMLCLDVVWLERTCGKVLGVLCHDDIGMSEDCGGQDVTIIRIGQVQSIDKRLVANYEAVGNGLVHERSSSR